MAIIGTFTRSEQGFYAGRLSTLTVEAKLRLIPVERKASEAAPDYRVYSGRAEPGAAWAKSSDDGRSYLSVALDDPSLANPINAALIEGDTDPGTYNLVGTRPERA